MPDNQLVPAESAQITQQVYHPAFNNIVGQSTAKRVLSMSLASAAKMRRTGQKIDIAQPAFFGQAGCGKTELMRTFGKTLCEILDIPYLEIESPKDYRTKVITDPLFNEMAEMKGFYLGIDEFHKMEKNMVAHSMFQTLFLKMLDRQNTGRAVQVGDSTFVADRSNIILSLGTNHTNGVDDAIKSRMNVINLDLYTVPEMKEITLRLFNKHGLTIEENMLNRLANCGRGTARPIVTMINDGFLPLCTLRGSNEVTEAMIMDVLQQQEMYLCGLNKPEVQMLASLMEQGAMSRQQIKSKFPTLNESLNESLAYIQNLSARLITVETNGKISLTRNGRTYIKRSTEYGFRF